MRHRRKTAVLMVAVTLSMSVASPVRAAAPRVQVDETMYVNMDYYGKTTTVNVVKGCSTNGVEQYTDYGVYDKVVNMTDKTEPKLGDGSVTWQLPEGNKRFYYQCTMPEGSVDLPWTFDISYKLNGVEAEASKLAGASGLVEINVKAFANKNARAYYKNNMVLTVVFPVDMEKCYSVDAPGSQLQSVGNNTVVMFAALPGEDGDYTVRIGTDDYESVGVVMMMVPGTVDALNNIKDLKEAKDTWREDGDQMYDSMNELLRSMEAMKTDVTQVRGGLNSLDNARSQINGNRKQIEALSTQALNDLASVTEQTSKVIPYLETARSAVTDINANMDAIYNTMEDTQDELDRLYDRLGGLKSSLNSMSDRISQGITPEEQKQLADAISQQTAEIQQILEILGGQLGGSGGAYNLAAADLKELEESLESADSFRYNRKKKAEAASDSTGAAGNSGTDDSDGSAENTGSANNADTADNSGSVNNSGAVENTGSAENAGTADKAGAADDSGSANNAGTADKAGAADNAGSANNAGTTDSSGAADNAGSADKAGTADSSGAADNSGSANNADASDKSGASDHSNSADAADAKDTKTPEAGSGGDADIQAFGAAADIRAFGTEADMNALSGGPSGLPGSGGVSDDDFETWSEELDPYADNVEEVLQSLSGTSYPAEVGAILQKIQAMIGDGTAVQQSAGQVIGKINAVCSDVGNVGSKTASTVSALRSVTDELINLLDDTRVLIDTTDSYVPSMLDALSDTQELMNRLTRAMGSTHDMLSLVNSTMIAAGDSLDAGTKNSLEGLQGLLDKSLTTLDSITSVRTASEGMKDTLDEQLDKYEDENNFLNMDPEADKISFTSSKNPSPHSLQIILRTDEISDDDEATDISDMEDAENEEAGPFTRMWRVITKIFHAVIDIFTNR
ncbi:hypothetical protein [uncultured Clostridium sp.]|uniref:hypothetical protein n=1 Tax=uncultured Clostridium sp. TaxID=59620 RepID=UPI0025ED45F1|nr:hypothetical protein [uncultured Clostridium sp.]